MASMASFGDDWKPGMRVTFHRDSVCGHAKAGATGRLSAPRECRCGPGGERCWDIVLDAGGGIQAHGGAFELSDPHDVNIDFEEELVTNIMPPPECKLCARPVRSLAVEIDGKVIGTVDLCSGCEKEVGHHLTLVARN